MFNAHVLIMFVQIYMTVNKLCSNQQTLANSEERRGITKGKRSLSTQVMFPNTFMTLIFPRDHVRVGWGGNDDDDDDDDDDDGSWVGRG